MTSIFNKEFWLSEWQKDKSSDTYSVHKGYSSAEYWDKAAGSYNQDENEVKSRRQDKTLGLLERNNLLFEGMEVLDIGCGTGMLSIALAHRGANVTAIDFSKGMLDQFRHLLSMDENEAARDKISIHQGDWHTLDIEQKNWKDRFDLVIAFMSPGVATPDSFFKMINCSKNGCAIRGWAAKQTHPILAALWEKIMDTQLEDKPQSILFKINLLFSLGVFPEISFDTVEWNQDTMVQEELDRQRAFFKKVSDKPGKDLERIIRSYLESICDGGRIIRKHKGLTATAVWKKRSGSGM
ncbi:MAG: class I SAM-dependent methyltransferase [Desulfobacula sp.]|nr:class I SAM-dependent methyltransferase [Desulfobacula sp.]